MDDDHVREIEKACLTLETEGRSALWVAAERIAALEAEVAEADDVVGSVTGKLMKALEKVAALEAQRDELLAALERCDIFLRVHAKPRNELKCDVQDAIARARGETDGS